MTAPPLRSAACHPVSERHMRSLLAAYIDQGRGINLSPHTLRAIGYHVHDFLRDMADRGIKTPAHLHREHLRAWSDGLLARRTARGLALKPGTVNKKIECVRGFLRHLADEGLIAGAMPGVLLCVKEPRLLPHSVLTDAQVRSLLRTVRTDSTEGYRDRTILELLYTSGIRAAELLGLNVTDVDLGNGLARVMGKGRKERMVPVGQTALRHLETYLVAIRPFLADPNGDADTRQALFLGDRGQRLAYHSLRRLVHRHAKAACLPVRVTAHTFRRSCTTELLRSGANMYHVKELLGHESLDTLNHYARLTITDLRATHRRCHPRERAASQPVASPHHRDE